MEASSHSAPDFAPSTTIAGPRGIRNSRTGVAGSDRAERTTNAAPHRSSNTQTVRRQFPVTEARLTDRPLLRPIKVRDSYGVRRLAAAFVETQCDATKRPRLASPKKKLHRGWCLPLAACVPPCVYPSRSKTAPTINGNATVASSKTSANRPPSSNGTNFPHETASV